MKKLSLLLLSAILLFGCSESTDESSYDSFSPEEYQSKAHSQLENYSDTTDASADCGEAIPAESPDDSAEEISDAVAEDSGPESVPEVSVTDTSDISDKPTAVTQEIILVTVDIAYEDGTAATLVCGHDGSVDLYFANGYEMRNMGEKDDCREMGEKLINACKKHLDSFVKATEFPFPESGTTFVYIKTDGGVYKIGYDNTQILLGAEGDIEICVKNAMTNITKYAKE